jgi:hypothetical protein
MNKSAQLQDQPDEQHRSDYPQAPACPPSGIPLVAASSAEQKKQDNDQQ